MENIKLYRTVPSPLPLSGAGQGRPNSVPSWNLTLSRRQPGLGSQHKHLEIAQAHGEGKWKKRASEETGEFLRDKRASAPGVVAASVLLHLAGAAHSTFKALSESSNRAPVKQHDGSSNSLGLRQPVKVSSPSEVTGEAKASFRATTSTTAPDSKPATPLPSPPSASASEPPQVAAPKSVAAQSTPVPTSPVPSPESSGSSIKPAESMAPKSSPGAGAKPTVASSAQPSISPKKSESPVPDASTASTWNSAMPASPKKEEIPLPDAKAAASWNASVPPSAKNSGPPKQDVTKRWNSAIPTSATKPAEPLKKPAEAAKKPLPKTSGGAIGGALPRMATIQSQPQRSTAAPSKPAFAKQEPQGKTWAEKAVLAAGAVTFGSVVAIVVLMVRGWQLQDPLLKGICAAGIAGAAAIVALVNFIRKPSKGGSASPQAA